jgi:hypothetical protein
MPLEEGLEGPLVTPDETLDEFSIRGPRCAGLHHPADAMEEYV